MLIKVLPQCLLSYTQNPPFSIKIRVLLYVAFILNILNDKNLVVTIKCWTRKTRFHDILSMTRMQICASLGLYVIPYLLFAHTSLNEDEKIISCYYIPIKKTYFCYYCYCFFMSIWIEVIYVCLCTRIHYIYLLLSCYFAVLFVRCVYLVSLQSFRFSFFAFYWKNKRKTFRPLQNIILSTYPYHLVH